MAQFDANDNLIEGTNKSSHFQGTCLVASKGTYGYIQTYDTVYLNNNKHTIRKLQHTTHNLCVACYFDNNMDIDNIENRILEMEGKDTNYINPNFYYGYKECQKKGVKYTYPNPNLHNNAP